MEPILKRELCGVARDASHHLDVARDRFVEQIALAAREWKRQYDAWQKQTTEDTAETSARPLLPIPVPRGEPKRAISLAEKYAVVAAVYDAHGCDGDSLGPWMEHAGEPLADNYLWHLTQLCRQGSGYAALDATDVDEIRVWLEDVKRDLEYLRTLRLNSERRLKAVKRKWLPGEIAAEVARHISAHQHLIEAARRGDLDAKGKIEETLRRNAIAKAIGCSQKPVGAAPRWREIAEEFHWLPDKTQSARGSKQTKVGFDIGVERASIDQGDTTVAEVERRETLAMFDAAIANIANREGRQWREMREGLSDIKRELESNTRSDDSARELLELMLKPSKDCNPHEPERSEFGEDTSGDTRRIA